MKNATFASGFRISIINQLKIKTMKTRIIASKSMKKDLMVKTRQAIYKVIMHFPNGKHVCYLNEDEVDMDEINRFFPKLKHISFVVCGWTSR